MLLCCICKLKFVFFIHNRIVINLVSSWCGAAHKIYAHMCLYRRDSLSRKTFAVCTFCKDIFFLEIGHIRVIWAEDFILHTFNAFLNCIYVFFFRIRYKYSCFFQNSPELVENTKTSELSTPSYP